MANWTYAQVKAADAALSPPAADPAAAASALNAQTVSLSQPANAIGIRSVVSVLLLSQTFDWARVQALAAQSLSATWQSAPTAQDEAILIAQAAVHQATDPDASVDPAHWSAFAASLGALASAAAVSPASQAAILALARMTAPVFDPPLIPGDIQTARAF